MNTIKGDIPADLMTKVETFDEVPHGVGVTTQWFFENELVRQDFEFRVREGILGAGSANL